MSYAPYDPYAQPDPYAAYPPYGAAPAPYAATAYADEVRTVFITGFPADVKERELNNMLRFLPGYEASQMNWKHGQAQGFALFANAAHARAAIDAISQLCFDDSAILRAEMAHKNMYLKDDPASKRPRLNPAAPTAFSGPAPTPYQHAPVIPSPVRPQGYAAITNSKDNPPCNTLFIGNLGDTVSDAELKGLFGSQQGFRQLKLVKGPKNVTCFVEMEDVPTAMAVHTSLQGAILATSDRGAIRIQYSRNPFGKKRDSSGVYIDTPATNGAPYPGAIAMPHPEAQPDAQYQA